MNFLKSHRGAMAIAALVIALSVLFGFHRSATAARAAVEEQFYTGADGSGYSIASDLDQRRAAAQNLLVVAGRYLDEGDMAMADVAAAVRELERADSPADKYVWNQALEENTEALRAALADQALTEKDAGYVENLRAELAGRADAIRRDPYNQRADQFNHTVLGVFPANLLKRITFVRDAEAFR